ncbi:MAG: alpha/beta fold hydrolase [Methyloceanibacter sp.]|nr:alpha/beta fold hydrolase [Methyloceanibacter sp.]
MRKIEACLKQAAKAAVALCFGLGLIDEARAVYDVKSGEIPGKPGSIIRVWPLEGGGPGGGDAFRILYRSTGLKGEPIAVSGAIFIPPGAPPAGGRNVIAWAHPTSGVVEACAPSLMPDVSGMIWGLAGMLKQGYVVVATDYPGLGVPGQIHPYLIGVSEGRAVLDSVRAARALPRSGASNRFAVWGHSQGGHASLYTGELAASYAPDLKLVGVAAAAPATYLVELFDADKSSSTGKELTAMALYSWSKLYKQPATGLVQPGAMGAFERMAHDCIESVAEFAAIEKAEKPLEHQQFLKVDPTEVEPWRGIMQRNTPGQMPAGAPVFIAQGTADTTVPPQITKRFGNALCKQGTRVSFILLNGVSHTFAAKNSVGPALAWMGDRFRGAPAPSDCQR